MLGGIFDEEFGNRSPTWGSFKEYCREAKLRATTLVHIRNRVANGPTWYNIHASEVKQVVHRLLSQGYKEEQFYFSLMAPTHLTVIQGEIQQSCQHLDLYFSMVKLPMRQSLIEGGKQVSGLRARLILESYLDGVSLDHVNYLLTAYPNHVIEFSTYSRNWGTIPNRNTVIWEIRNY